MTKTVTTGKATDLITFTRSTTGTYLDSVKYGDELITNGTFDSNLDGWSGAGWVWSDGKAYDSGASVTDGLEQIIPTVANSYYVIEYTLSGISGGTPSVQFRGQSAIIHDSDVTNGRVIVQALAATSKVEVIGGAATFYIDNISVKEIIGNQGTSGEPLLRTADTNEHRIEYDADGNLKGLLIEEQRTNLVSASNFNNVSKQEVTTVNNYTVAPDGTNTAVAMFETTNNNFHRAYNNVSFLNGNTYTQSVFLKSIGGRAGQLTMTASGFGSIHANFDLINGVVGTKNNCESQITPVGNGWYRCSITATAIGDAGGDASVVSVTSPTSTRLQNYAGDTSKGLLVYGLQVETGSFPTSYIPTSGSTVTRNSDAADISTSKFEYNEDKSCVLIEASYLGADSNEYPRLLDFNTGSNTPSIWANTQRVYIDKASVGAQVSAVWDMSPSKIAASVTSGDIALVVNDGAVQTSTTTLVSTSPRFTIGSADGGSWHMSGHIKTIKYYPVRLTNNQLKALTQ